MNPATPPTSRSLRSDRRGAVYVEFLVAFLPIFIFFECLAQLADMYGAKLIVEHAAYRAARAASVVFGDDCEKYDTRGKLYDIHIAAMRVLEADASIVTSDIEFPGGTGGFPHGAVASVKITAVYECAYPFANRILCQDFLGTPFRDLTATVSMPVHNPSFSAGNAEGCE